MSAWLVAALAGVVAAQLGGDVASSPAETGEQAWHRLECGRCHATGRPDDEAERDKSCVRCHQAIVEGSFFADPLQLERWRSRIVHLRDVPRLDVAGRLRSSWIASYVERPHDLRRGLGESMPRLPVTREEAVALAAFLTEGREPDERPVRRGTAARGLVILEAKGCTSCHSYTGLFTNGAARPVLPRPIPIPVDGLQMSRGLALAPDLRFTRARTTPAVVDEWLKSKEQQAGRVMPIIPLTDDERADVLAAIFEAPLGPLPRREPPARLPVLSRTVRFAEVQERVLGKTCIHCHADDSAQMGIGGPGNNGGFGYAGTGLVLSSYVRAQAGSVSRETGKHQSIYRPVATGPLAGLPLLVAQLRARQLEEAGELVEGVVGMPLGLPALTPEELQLVETWVAQGRPQ